MKLGVCEGSEHDDQEEREDRENERLAAGKSRQDLSVPRQPGQTNHPREVVAHRAVRNRLAGSDVTASLPAFRAVPPTDAQGRRGVVEKAMESGEIIRAHVLPLGFGAQISHLRTIYCTSVVVCQRGQLSAGSAAIACNKA